jgi:hypothetical protein
MGFKWGAKAPFNAYIRNGRARLQVNSFTPTPMVAALPWPPAGAFGVGLKWGLLVDAVLRWRSPEGDSCDQGMGQNGRGVFGATASFGQG